MDPLSPGPGPASPSISQHGLIGDLQTAALVGVDGSIDWFCTPRFDSPSVFAGLLDDERGGRFRIGPAEGASSSRQLYFPRTAVLITRFMSAGGVGELVDFMPVTDRAVTDHHRIVRLVRVVRGEMRFELECRPRFDYGRLPHHLDLDGGRARFHSPAVQVALGTTLPLEADGDDVTARFSLRAGQAVVVVLDTGQGHGGEALAPGDGERLFVGCSRYWRTWLSRSTYRGRWRDVVERAAITLKLMTYAPTGALVAAPSAGLPEQLGGERNWDYRYTWVRDASFSVAALVGLGFTDEAEGFVGWLGDRVKEQVGRASGPLKVMYRVDGTSDLVETTLDHLGGYRGSTPVRIGNGAADQLQLDIYGEMLDALHIGAEHDITIGHEFWTSLAGIVDWLCDHWHEPDDGIWETRGGRQAFTYSRLMSWVAFDRAIRMADRKGRPADLPRWHKARDDVYRWIMERAWNPQRQAFVQHEGSDVLDASLLQMPLCGFIAPRDPRWLSTLDAIDAELVTDSLVYRYNPEASPDGLRGVEGTFSMCTFWYVDAMAQAGRLEQAGYAFEKMLTYGNALGLFSEETGLEGDQLGNYPQAFSHLALAGTALRLDRLIESEPVAPIFGRERWQL